MIRLEPRLNIKRHDRKYNDNKDMGPSIFLHVQLNLCQTASLKKTKIGIIA